MGKYQDCFQVSQRLVENFFTSVGLLAKLKTIPFVFAKQPCNNLRWSRTQRFLPELYSWKLIRTFRILKFIKSNSTKVSRWYTSNNTERNVICFCKLVALFPTILYKRSPLKMIYWKNKKLRKNNRHHPYTGDKLLWYWVDAPPPGGLVQTSHSLFQGPKPNAHWCHLQRHRTRPGASQPWPPVQPNWYVPQGRMEG